MSWLVGRLHALNRPPHRGGGRGIDGRVQNTQKSGSFFRLEAPVGLCFKLLVVVSLNGTYMRPVSASLILSWYNSGCIKASIYKAPDGPLILVPAQRISAQSIRKASLLFAICMWSTSASFRMRNQNLRSRQGQYQMNTRDSLMRNTAASALISICRLAVTVGQAEVDTDLALRAVRSRM